MIIEVVFLGSPEKVRWNKKHTLAELMRVFTPRGQWIATGHDGTILDPAKPVDGQVSDGERIYISRQAGTAA